MMSRIFNIRFLVADKYYKFGLKKRSYYINEKNAARNTIKCVICENAIDDGNHKSCYQSFMYLQRYMIDEDKSEVSSLTKKKNINNEKILRQGIM